MDLLAAAPADLGDLAGAVEYAITDPFVKGFKLTYRKDEGYWEAEVWGEFEGEVWEGVIARHRIAAVALDEARTTEVDE